MDKTLTLENNLEQVEVLATFVEELCEELGVGPALVFNLNLALEEAVTNVIMYAFPQEELHTFTLRARKEGAVLSFELQDGGAPFDPTTEAPETDTTLSAEERPIGGLGIFLIRQIMDTVSYRREDGCNILTMTKTV